MRRCENSEEKERAVCVFVCTCVCVCVCVCACVYEMGETLGGDLGPICV